MSTAESSGFALPNSAAGSTDTVPRYLLAGRSSEGRPIWFETVVPLDRSLHVLLVAGQHGDEPEATQALRALVGHQRAWLESLGIGIGVVANANPDGRAAGTRETAGAVDLNRDHFELRTSEAASLHQVLRSWRWDAVIDLHTYPSRRRAALRRGWVLDDDVLLSTTTAPGALTVAGGVTERELVRDLTGGLDSAGITVGEYRLFQPSGRIRRGTMSPVDLRNVAALRYGALGVLVEGRAPRRDDPPDERARLITAQSLVVGHLLAWISAHRARFNEGRSLPCPGELVAVAGRWKASGRPGRASVRDSRSGERLVVELTPYLDTVEVTRTVPLPRAYAVAREERPLREILLRQGFRTARHRPGARLAFPVGQLGGVALATWLERWKIGTTAPRRGIVRIEEESGDRAAPLRVRPLPGPGPTLRGVGGP